MFSSFFRSRVRKQDARIEGAETSDISLLEHEPENWIRSSTEEEGGSSGNEPTSAGEHDESGNESTRANYG